MLHVAGLATCFPSRSYVLNVYAKHVLFINHTTFLFLYISDCWK